MDIELEKNFLIERIKQINDADLLQTIKDLLDIDPKTGKDFWDIISENEKEAIQQGLDDVENEGLFPMRK